MPLFFTEVWYKPRTVIKTRWRETEGGWPLLKKSRTLFKPRTVIRICGRLPRKVNWSHLFGWLSRHNSGFLVRLSLIVRAFDLSRIVSCYKEVVIYIEVQLNGGQKSPYIVHILSWVQSPSGTQKTARSGGYVSSQLTCSSMSSQYPIG